MYILGIVLLASCLDLSFGLNINGAKFKRQINTSSREKRIVCYYTSWAGYRKDEGKFGPEDIPPYLCTHLMYAFGAIGDDFSLTPFDTFQDIEKESYARITNLKKENPELKVLLSIGGSREGSAKYTALASDPQRIRLFVKSSLEYIKQFNFDGLDLVWQYPNGVEGSSAADKKNYVTLVKELKAAFKDNFILTIVVPISAELLDLGYQLDELTKYVDFMNIVNYNYHTATEVTVGHVAPLYSIPLDYDKRLNIDYTVNEYLKRGVDPYKLSMGIPLYGISFFLDDPEETDIGSTADDEGNGSEERGSIFYNKLCKRIMEETWTVIHYNKTALGPYAYKDKLWVSYDDEEIIKTKAHYAVEKKIGGLMFWSISMDDFSGQCHSRTFPLIKAAREAFFSKRSATSSSKPKPTVTSPPTKSSTVTNPSKPTKPSIATRTSITTKPSIATRPSIVTRSSLATGLPSSYTEATILINDNDDDLSQSQPRPRPNYKNEFPSETDDNFFPIPSGNRTFISNRDIVFQNFKIWISNNYYQRA